MQAKKEGQQIENIVLIESGKAVMSRVGEFARALDHKVSEGDVEDAYLMASDMLRDTLVGAGEFDQAKIDAESNEVRQKFGAEIKPIEDRMNAARQRAQQEITQGAV